MQRTVLFRKLLYDRKFDPQCPLIMDQHIEYELILKMSEINPKDRPSAYDIQQKWIPKWKEELVDQQKQQVVMNALAEANKKHSSLGKPLTLSL